MTYVVKQFLTVARSRMAAQPSQQQQPPPPPPAAAPKTRLGLSLAERIKVIEARQMGKSMRQLAAQFGCGKTQILNTLAQKERYVREWEVMGRNNPSIGARKRFRHTRNEQINRSVHEWYQQQAASGLRITGPMLQKQARHYATHLGIMNFAASNGWLANFRRFYNIISCSPHPRKRKTSIPLLSDKNDDDPKASTSKCELEVNNGDGRSRRSSAEETIQNVPSAEENARSNVPTPTKSRPVSEDDQTNYLSPRNENRCDSFARHDSATPHQSNTVGSNSSEKTEVFPRVQVSKPQSTTTSTLNHRKRRLLQLDLQDDPPPAKSVEYTKPIQANFTVEERKLPKLHPIPPMKVHFSEFLNVARSKGLLTTTMRDDCGNEWIEIRQSVAMFRVPNHGYPTHLCRLVVDSSLQYYLEVLGDCIQKGSLISNDNSSSFNRSEAVSILDALSGAYAVCQGVEYLSDRMDHLHMKTVQEIGVTENVHATLPDYRFRSNDCSLWIDARLGPKCDACKSACSHHLALPMDLRCPPSHLHHER